MIHLVHETASIIVLNVANLRRRLKVCGAGIDVEVFEQARELPKVRVGTNLLPHATGELRRQG